MATHFIKGIPKGDSKLRDICNKCSFVNYENPRVIVSSVTAGSDDSIQLIQRDGEWTLPYDFMRVGETSKESAARLSGARADHLLAFDEMPEQGFVIMTFRSLTESSGNKGTFFKLDQATEKLAGNPAAIHALEVYQRTRAMKRFAPGFLRHSFNVSAKPALEMLHVPAESHCVPVKGCRSCSFDRAPKVKIVSGVVAALGDMILLAQRAIPPRIGYWTLPAGFMELGETLREGAAREGDEETGADIEVGDLLAIYEIPEFGQIMPVFRGVLKSDKILIGPESMAAGLFTWNEILKKEASGDLAFPMVKEALNKFNRNKNVAAVAPCHMRLQPVMPGQQPVPGKVL